MRRMMIRRMILLAVFGLVLAGNLLGETAKEAPALRLVRAARAYVGLKCKYDGSYRVMAYPGGDPGGGVGVCSDLVVRSYRAIGLDLQVLVHEDIKKNFSAYPVKKLYNQDQPDTNIDHRRVPNLMIFFQRKATILPASLESENLKTWQAGDIVIFDLLDNGLPSHIGIVSDRKADSGLPLVIHHFPPYPTEDDSVKNWKIIGHFRYFPAPPAKGKSK